MRRSVEGGWKRSVCSEPRWPPILLQVAVRRGEVDVPEQLGRGLLPYKCR